MVVGSQDFPPMGLRWRQAWVMLSGNHMHLQRIKGMAGFSQQKATITTRAVCHTQHMHVLACLT